MNAYRAVCLAFVSGISLAAVSCSHPYGHGDSLRVPCTLAMKGRDVRLGAYVHRDDSFTLFLDCAGQPGAPGDGGRREAWINLPGGELMKIRIVLEESWFWSKRMKASGRKAYEVRYANSSLPDNHMIVAYVSGKGSAGCVLAISSGETVCMTPIDADATGELLELTDRFLTRWKSPGTYGKEGEAGEDDDFAAEEPDDD